MRPPPGRAERRRDVGVVLVFAGATFASAWLMFSVEPLLAKMLLPQVGGAAAVWNTALVFFQAALLAGYAFAHAVSKAGPKKHAIVHVVVVACAAVALPLRLHLSLAEGAPPAVRVLVLLTAAAGLPFFALATNGPALARQFSSIDHAHAKDPYFLYAASNAGSVAALLSYPFVVERWVPLARQVRWFGAGYAVLVALVAACTAVVLRARALPLEPSADGAGATDASAIPRRRVLWWILLGAVPSAHLVTVTQYLTTNVAAAPLLWIVPLFVYLGSFVLVFARRLRPPHAWMARALPLAAAMATATITSEVNQPAILVACMHLATFFFASMVCHGALANDRPPASQLTAFYLWMSTGGVVGGLAAAMLAPAVLDRYAEYPLVIVVALALRPAPDGVVLDRSRRALGFDLVFAAACSALMLACVHLVRTIGATGQLASAILAAPLFVLYRTLDRPVRFALAIGGVVLASATHQPYGGALLRERNFFGALRVARDPTGHFMQLVHGSTVHGRQALDPARRAESTSYYHATGPVGDVFALHRAGPPAPVGIVGLGVGSVAAYARSGESWTFYEINPAVARIAQDPAYFTFLSDVFPRDATQRIEIGDARLRLAATDERFALLVVDAFSSDAIPVHLVTVEAVRVYLSRLRAGGVLAWHISNDYLELEPMMAALAAHEGLSCWVRLDLDVTGELSERGKFESKWAVMARSDEHLGAKLTTKPWRRAAPRPGVEAWTDDASSIVPLLGKR